MNLTQLLIACIAALFVPLRSSLASVRTVQKKAHGIPAPYHTFTAILFLAVALFFANYSAAQEAAPASDSDRIAGDKLPAPAVTEDSNAIMGFETPAAWTVRIDGLFPDFNVQSTTTRTQGSAALAVVNPPNLLTLTSSKVASTATALTGIGNQGALLQLDILLPTESNESGRDGKEGYDPANAGWIDGFVSVPSRGLLLVPLGHVAFTKYRTGTYNTVGFSVPDFVSSRLNGADFNDMVFVFAVGSPSRVPWHISLRQPAHPFRRAGSVANGLGASRRVRRLP
jgi:hypothetical protein